MNRRAELGIGNFAIGFFMAVILLSLGSLAFFSGYLDYNGTLPSTYSALNTTISNLSSTMSGIGLDAGASKDEAPGDFEGTEIGFFKRSLKVIGSLTSITTELPSLFKIFKEITFFQWIPTYFWNILVILLGMVFAILAGEAWLRYKVS